jgi:hypothetical protein
METACTYFTRRALQERTKAADACTPEARKVHLELALRLVKVATEPHSLAEPEAMPLGLALDASSTAACLKGVGNALARAFPLRPSDIFKELLEAIDAAQERRRIS